MLQNSTEEAIDQFFGDASVQRLITTTATWQPLQICYPREVNISRLLAWLLDPTEGHGLGDLAIQSLLTRAWWNSAESTLPLATRRFLAPSSVHTEGFSSILVTTEVDLDGKSLDVLLIDPGRRRYIAIENKFGAKQSMAQLPKYRKSLEKLLADFLGVHILLDSNEAEPEDSAWIAVGYDWLAEFLREAEQRESTAEHVRQTLQQFRTIIEDEAEDAVSSTAYGDLVIEVSSGHPQVLLDVMKPWLATAKGSRAKLLAQLLAAAATLEGKARLRLFQLYWRRKAVWDHCIRQAQFAPFVLAMKERFDEILVDPKRIRIAFSLDRWKSLAESADGDFFYPAGVNITQTGDTYQVTSFIQLNDVRGDRRDALIGVAQALRRSNAVKRRLGDEQAFVVLRRSKDLSKAKAVNMALIHCSELETALEPIL